MGHACCLGLSAIKSSWLLLFTGTAAVCCCDVLQMHAKLKQDLQPNTDLYSFKHAMTSYAWIFIHFYTIQGGYIIEMTLLRQ
jgi:hypothetical protein